MGRCYWLEHLVDPFAKATCDATNIGADGSCGPTVHLHPFMNFICHVERATWGELIVLDVIQTVLTIHVLDKVVVSFKPVGDGCVHV